MNQSHAAETTDLRRGLSSRAFLGFLLTQFLGAVNDNMFRWIVVPIAKYKVDTQFGSDYESVVLGAGLACFVIPYLLLSTYAGFLADRFSKQTIIVGCKMAEIVIMVLGVAAISFGNIYVMFMLVALMGSQSAIFSPSKLGIIPEIVREDKLSWANGLVGLTTVVAVVVGTVAGNFLYDLTKPDGLTKLWLSASAIWSVATFGWLASLIIEHVPAANPDRSMPRNPVTHTWDDLRRLGKNRPILRVAVGIAFFWSVAALAQLNVDTYGIKQLGLAQKQIGMLLGILSLGVGIGSVLAGLWSGGRVELGIVPLGAATIAVSSILLSTAVATTHPYIVTCVLLFLLGCGGGLFNIPLISFMQQRSPKASRGSMLAASNFITFSGLFLVSLLFPLLQAGLKLDARAVFLVVGVGTIPVALYVILLIPQASVRFLVWLASLLAYRIRVLGRQNVPEVGGALIVANHVSWIDAVLILLVSSRPIRMVMHADYMYGIVGWTCRLFEVIPIRPGARAMLRSLKTAREAISNGELVCIFAEGTITRTGQLQPFQRGLMRIVKGTGTPVIPAYLNGLWGSIFSFRGGRFFWKLPRRWPSPISIHFGEPLTEPEDVHRIRQAVATLEVQAVEMLKERKMIPVRTFLRKCRSALFRPKIADSSGVELTGGKLLTGSLAMMRLLNRQVLKPEENMVGLLLPPSVAGVVANAAVTMSHRVAVNLNYTLAEETVNYCIKQCQIKHVLTSRRFLEKRPFNLNAEVVFLEDVKEQVRTLDKLAAAMKAYLLPSACLEVILGLKKMQPDDLLTIIFTSGSTGEPKGVMLSHNNVASNIAAVDQLFQITDRDVLLGVLPFFHSFGYTATLWLTLTLDPKAVYHFNPLDARQIGKLCAQHGMTIILATPTFLRSYLQRIDRDQMNNLDLAIVGAEKLSFELAKAFEEKFGVAPTEGYGTTELSPVATFNIPDHRSGREVQGGTRTGTVGRVMPGTAAKIVDPNSSQDLGVNQDGLLFIKGPNVMLGYLNQPEKTSEVIHDGWYNTGDIACIDDDGFITITGRQSRFSKIGGEMVPHIRIEEALTRIIGYAEADEPEINVAVTAVSDEKKGERLVVLHKTLPKSIDQVLKELSEAGLPNLWIPSANSFCAVNEIPLLGTGKLDLKAIHEYALKAFGISATDQNK